MARRSVPSITRRQLIGGVAASLTVGVAAAGTSRLTVTPAGAQDGGLAVVATTGQVADIARNVGGDLVSVTPIMGAGIDPHSYTPSEGDLQRLFDGEVILYSGLNLEGRFGEVFEALGGDKPVVALTDGFPPEQLLASPQYPDQFDPHVWFDPDLWSGAVTRAAAALGEADGDNAATYEANAAAHVQQLAAFAAEAETVLATVPETQRVLVTAHDAFNYFGRRFGFEVVGIQGISTETEAGVNDLQRVAELIAERQIPAIFVETSVSPATIEAVQAAVRDRGFEVTVGGSLYSEALGDEGTPEGTYLGMYTHNVNTITTALGGTGRIGATATPAATRG